MKIPSTIWRILLVVAVGVLLALKLMRDADSTFMFDPMAQGLIGIVFIAILIFNYRRDIRNFRSTRTKTSFTTTSIGILCTLLIILNQVRLSARDWSEIVIQASNDGGFNGCGFEFREDGTYKFFNGSGLGVDYFRGTYAINDSIIIMDKSNIDNCTSTNQLAIRGKVIYHINQQHEVVNKDMDFTINLDKR